VKWDADDLRRKRGGGGGGGGGGENYSLYGQQFSNLRGIVGIYPEGEESG